MSLVCGFFFTEHFKWCRLGILGLSELFLSVVAVSDNFGGILLVGVCWSGFGGYCYFCFLCFVCTLGLF